MHTSRKADDAPRAKPASSHANPSGWAKDVARQLLSDLQPRLAHTLGVSRRANWVGRGLGLTSLDTELLKAAAVLHDIGYSPVLDRTGFHPLDGASYVLAQTGNEPLAGLVAHHSHAQVEARLRGLARVMGQFEKPDPTLADALAYCDMTVGPQGQPMSVDQRLDDIQRRYGPDHVVGRAVAEARPLLLAAVGRTEARIRACVCR